jgi:hypothetical protein
MTQAKERLFTNTDSENESIILDLEEFDLNNLASLKETTLGQILDKKFSSDPTGHTQHSSHSSHSQFSNGMW